MFDVYFHNRAFEKASRHFSENAGRRLEALGFLTGGVFTSNGRKYVIVDDYLTAENNATAVTVSFSRLAFKEISRQLREPGDRVIVGWCHSHPGYGCFLSATDVRTQRFFFPEDFHVAVVCDPLSGDWKAFKLAGAGYAEVSMAVIQRKRQEPDKRWSKWFAWKT